MDIATKKLSYSKERARDGYNMEPIMGATLNTRVPCFGPDSDKIVLPTEIETDLDHIAECTKHDWLSDNGIGSENSRFSTIESLLITE